ncbi:MAG TPA: Riboflavin biosynthesis protein RibBA [Hyphomicrobiaceae bacterium MAG_BT-2024]
MSQKLKTPFHETDKSVISSTENLLHDLRNGRMVILVDAEDRENEGDLVIPAQMATPDVINFMATYGRGLVCLSLMEERARQLRLESMVRTNSSRTGTAFTVSIEAREGITTGISAHDRARTIAAAIDPTKDHTDIVSPGHVFPLVARSGGVLMRAGHTEASIDLARLAGLYPAAVICEIMKDDGTMARLPDLLQFAQKHNLKVGTIEDLVAFRLRNDRVVQEVSQTPVTSTIGGDFMLHLYEATASTVEHVAMVKGNIYNTNPVMVRVHVLNILDDLLGVRNGSDGCELIQKSMTMIAEEGCGVLVLIQDQRAKAISMQLANYKGNILPERNIREQRIVDVGVGSQILRDLGIKDMILLTNSPKSVYVGLDGYGLRIIEHRSIV